MAKEYTPRRANLTRWLQGAPDYILDCFDSKNDGERYTVVFTTEHSSVTGSFAQTWISFLGMSGAPTHPQGVSMWGEMEAYKMRAYRERVRRQRVRWLDLPENIRSHVIARATDDTETPQDDDETFPHLPSRCPSNHWNRGDDVCADCGQHLG